MSQVILTFFSVQPIVIGLGFYVLTVRQLSHSPPVTSDPLSGQQTPSAGNKQPETTGRRLYYSPTMIMCLPIYCRTKTFQIIFNTVLYDILLLHPQILQMVPNIFPLQRKALTQVSNNSLIIKRSGRAAQTQPK